MAADVGTLQGKLELDMSGFNHAMNEAVDLVRRFGQQLQTALGSSTTQSFSAIQGSIQRLSSEMQSLIDKAQNLVNVMGQLDKQSLGNVRHRKQESSEGDGRVHVDSNAGNNLKEASTQAQNTDNNLKSASVAAKQLANNANSLQKSLADTTAFASNLKHIISGIVISQTFYRLLNVMKDLVSEANQFMTYIEQSSVSFKYLLGSKEEAQSFLTSLQDFAISSPLDMQGATKSARMLMTMGVEADNVIGVLRVLTDTATVAGGDVEDSIYRISLALGQMLQSGTVKAQEVRQLVNANIPIFKILREELGLTAKQIANIGKEGINSATAVNAILRGLQKNFGGASKDLQKTLTGALSAVKDSFYVLYEIAMKGPFNAIRDKVITLSEALSYLASVARNSGIGGVFEKLVPPELQPIIRNVIGALQQLGYMFKYIGAIAKSLFGTALIEIAHILSLILPPIAIFLNALMQLMHYLLQTYPIIRYAVSAFLAFFILNKIGGLLLWFWNIVGLGKICLHIASFVGVLVKALSWLAAVMVAHPAALIFTAIAGAALIATGAIQAVINKFKELLSFIGVKWASMNKTISQPLKIGYDPNKILQPVTNNNQKKADKYNKSLQNIAGSLDDVGDKANKAGKKLKQNFNQSFDEVYGINPTQNAAKDLGLGDINNLDLSDAIGQLDNFNSALDKLGDFNFSGLDLKFKEEWDKILKGIKAYLKENGLGALLAGALATLLTGNPWIGLAAGLAALFWPTLAEKLGLTTEDGKTLLGAALGALLGGVLAKITKAGIGTGIMWAGIGALLFAGLWPAIDEYIKTGSWKQAIQKIDFTLFGAGLGALIGNLIAGPAGAAVGTAVGAALGIGLGDALKEWNNSGDWKKAISKVNWTATGAGVGAAIGTAIAPGIGTGIGAAIGGLTGSIIDNIQKVLVELDGDWDLAGEAFKAWGEDIGKAFLDGLFGEGGLFGWSTEIFKFAGECFADIKKAFEQGDWARIGKDILMGVISGLLGAITFIFEPIARIFNAIVKAFCAVFGIHSPAKAMEPYGKNILLGLLEGMLDAIKNIGEYVAKIGKAIIDSFKTFFTGIGDKIGGWFAGAKDAIGTWINDTGTNIKNWASGSIKNIVNWSSDTATKIGDWVNNTGTQISTWVNKGVTNIADWANNTKNSFVTWSSNVGTKIGNWASSTTTKFTSWVSNTSNSLAGWFTNTKDKFVNWVSGTKDNIVGWSSGTKESISNWASVTREKIGGWVSTTKEKISNWYQNVKVKFDAFKATSFSDWCSKSLRNISDWARDTWSSIRTNIGNAISKVKDFLGINTEMNRNKIKIDTPTKKIKMPGHADGGIFNREHWAQFAEGNKAEAIIPLENKTAMQPFVDAISEGLTSSLAPIMLSAKGNQSGLQPLYVGTLIADERGLKELERKMEIIRIKEDRRR